MKKITNKIFLIPIILILAVAVVFPHNANAASFLDGAAVSVINNGIAIVANWMLGLTSTLVIVSGIFLSISINLTTHIGDFFNSIPALNDVWLVVRNMSSIFIIFALLYTSINTILGSSRSSIQALIGKVIMAGLLINFSLFFVKVAIDASNLISLQFYRAIAPQTSENFTTGKVFTDGGLSDVFMTSLSIPKIYQNKSVLKTADVSLSISFATIAGMIMMIVASFSFLAAAIAFTARTGILMFVMALSPVFFAGMIFPQIESRISKKLAGLLASQLIFMPVYLILMYVALKLISSPGFSAIFNQSANGVAAAGEGAFGPTFIGVIIQFVIAIMFINIPLFVALQVGAKGAGWVPQAKGVSKWVGGLFGNTAGQHLIGRGARTMQESFNASKIAASNPNLALLTNKAFGGVAGASFGGSKGGYDKRFDNYVKERVEYGKKNIDINDKDKKTYVTSGLSAWDSENKTLEQKLAAAKNRASNESLTSEEERQKAKKQVAELEIEQKSRQRAENEGTKDKYLADKALKDRKEEYAKNLEKQTTPGFVTNAARKEAADKFRKEVNKSADAELLSKIRKMAAEESKGEVPKKEEGGGNKDEPKA